MNIVIVTEVFFPDRIGGAGKYIYSLSQGLIARGHKVTVITRRVDDLSRSEEIEGLKIYRVEWAGIFLPLRPLFFWLGLREIFKAIIKSQSCDLLVFNQPLAAFLSLLLKETRGLRKVHIFQSSWADELMVMRGIRGGGRFKPLLLLMRRMERAVLEQIPRIVVLSEFSKNRIVGPYGIDADKITVIPPAVDTDRFKPEADKQSLRRKFGLPEDALILLTVRNLVPRMGLDSLIVAFKDVVKKFPHAYLVIAGSGFLENKLRVLAERLDLTPRVNFAGRLTEEALRNYYQLADLFILPTRCLEGFGLVTLEAMASGLPVLGTPVGATPEILSRFDASFLFAGTDPCAIAGKICGFLDSKPDWAQLGKRCREFVLREYSKEKWLNQMEGLFND